MCELCGCTIYIESGKQAILGRAEEIVGKLNLARSIVELFEDCERIAYEVVADSSPSHDGDQVLDVCRWVHSLHEPIYKERLPKYLEAAKDVFSRLPVKDDRKEAVTLYHQLEQLLKKINDAELESIKDGNIREALRAVKNVHDNNAVKKARVSERYGRVTCKDGSFPLTVSLRVRSNSPTVRSPIEFPEQVRAKRYCRQRNRVPFMSKVTETNSRMVDVRSMPSPARHSHIFKIFDEMSPGEKLLVVNDHKPIHLVQVMKHERRDFDAASYEAYQKGPKEWGGVFKKKEAAEPSQNDEVVITSFEKERTYNEDAFSPVPIYSTNEYRVILTYFKAGQFIPVHKPNIDVVFLVRLGTSEVVAGSERQQIKAYTDMEALHLVSPPPNDSDHEEVVEKLRNGRFGHLWCAGLTNRSLVCRNI